MEKRALILSVIQQLSAPVSIIVSPNTHQKGLHPFGLSTLLEPESMMTSTDQKKKCPNEKEVCVISTNHLGVKCLSVAEHTDQADR